MSDDPIKERIARAKIKAAADLRDMGYFVLKADDRNASLIGFRKTDIRIVRVVLDKITPLDRVMLKAIPFPDTSCSIELWLRKFGRIPFEKSKP
jgi:UDP-N-acetylmuramyl pentapeptide synthase